MPLRLSPRRARNSLRRGALTQARSQAPSGLRVLRNMRSAAAGYCKPALWKITSDRRLDFHPAPEPALGLAIRHVGKQLDERGYEYFRVPRQPLTEDMVERATDLGGGGGTRRLDYPRMAAVPPARFISSNGS